ncbi:hypothetical protein [Psychroserpens mesophilus]|uniref:hypothetical protein n=1 Tax=Psychroserpens mesophilus TaxID=325473 RepID=UPI003F492EAF
MRNFIFKVILFSILIVVSFLYLYSKRSNPLVDNFTTHNNNYEIINLGNSHGANIKYRDNKGKRFQRAGNTLYYDLQNYKYLQEHLVDNAMVIIPVSYFSFGLDENRTDYIDPNAFVNYYYMFLPSSSIYNYSFKKNIQVYLNKVKENYHSVIDERFFLVEKKVNDSLSLEEKLEHHAKMRSETHKIMAEYSDPEKNVIYLSALIEDIIKNGHQPVLLTMPYADHYNSKFSETWLDEHYYQYMNKIIDTYQVPYLNYSVDKRISTNDSLFSNSDHLNDKGRIYFSDILFEDLRKIQVLNQ